MSVRLHGGGRIPVTDICHGLEVMRARGAPVLPATLVREADEVVLAVRRRPNLQAPRLRYRRDILPALRYAL